MVNRSETKEGKDAATADDEAMQGCPNDHGYEWRLKWRLRRLLPEPEWWLQQEERLSRLASESPPCELGNGTSMATE